MRDQLVRFTVVVACATSALAAAGAASAAEDSCSYSLALRALTGPKGADATVRVKPGAACEAVEKIKKVQVKVFAGDGTVSDVRNLNDVDDGKTIELGDVERGRRVEADTLVQAGTRTYVVRAETTTKLRPDLVVQQVLAPAQTLTTRAIEVRAEIAELNGDVDADATVTLSWGPSVLATSPVEVGAGDSTWVTFEGVELESAVPVELTVSVGATAPAETDATNNAGTASVDVTEHELASRVVVPSLAGYGAQMNGHVYAGVLPAPPGSMPALEEKVKALEPQLVRIFFSEAQEAIPARMESFVKTVRLAHEAGATINVTYQTTARAKLAPEAFMTEFARVLEELVRTHGLTSVRWVTIQNEPNRTQLTLEQYDELHRKLHAQLVQRGLREQIGLMGGDLVEFGELPNLPFPDHRVWWEFMSTRMNDILDAYSVHIYWNYWDLPRMEWRLKDVRRIVDALPPEARKPVYVTEFGVRGILNFPGKPAFQPGYWEDGTQLTRTNISAFQQLWFNIAAAQLGFAGAIKWDAFWGKYDNSYNAAYYLIGPAEEGWPLFPAYHAFRLLLQTTQRGWQVLGVAPWEENDWQPELRDVKEKEIAAYKGPNGELTLVGLDSNGRGLNRVSADAPAAYSIAGLPPNATFNLATWNANGDGQNSIAGTVTTSATGVARFQVPLHAAFALTTVPLA